MTVTRIRHALLYLALGVVSFQLWKQTGDLPWTLGACGFAAASIRETLALMKEMRNRADR
jgi:VanZ family protein